MVIFYQLYEKCNMLYLNSNVRCIALYYFVQAVLLEMLYTMIKKHILFECYNYM